MKKFSITFCLITVSLVASATTFYEQLCAFNFNWKKYSMIAPKGEARTFKTDAEYVQAHLSCVIPILKNNPTPELSAEQQSTRNGLIILLDEYRLAGRFPLNHYCTERIPVFIDEHGTHCAVGYLMMRSGHDDLAQRISASDNYVWVKDIKDPEAVAWQQYSGFTMEELKLIQGAYDYYDVHAWYNPNKYETPQMPICTTAYFDDNYTAQQFSVYNPRAVYIVNPTQPTTTVKATGKATDEKKPAEKKEKFVWCKGEGDGKVINGKWEQNYGPGMPWIKGFFINGQRSGDWEEYFPGTQTLCRTESWRNNKLNGVRKRFDRASRLIEEIIFVEGSAVCKTNYDLNDSLTYVRIPQNDSIVATRVYNSVGKLIACGKEKIYNPSGLLWFQNIELTAMNSMQVSTRATQLATGSVSGSLDNNGGYNTGHGGQSFNPFQGNFQPSLVEYHKFGTWWYYAEQTPAFAAKFKNQKPAWYQRYQHEGNDLHEQTAMFGSIHEYAFYDSIMVNYNNNHIEHLYGYGRYDFVHYKLEYFSPLAIEQYEMKNYRYYYHHNNPQYMAVKSAGEYDSEGYRIGQWYYYDENHTAVREEKYLIPTMEEEVKEDVVLAGK
jgi:hypothetical protein